MALISKTKQGRKQRLRQIIAPNHIRQKALRAHLSKELRAKLSKRSVLLHKSDEVLVTSGEFKKSRGKVNDIDRQSKTVTIEGIFKKTLKGRENPVKFKASNLVVLTLSERKTKQKNKVNKTKKVSQTSKPSEKSSKL